MHNSIEQYLSEILTQAFLASTIASSESEARRFGIVTTSNRPELTQFQCNGAMPAAKIAKKNPFEIAEAIILAIPDEDKEIFKEIIAIRPGFINIKMTAEFLANWSSKLAKNERLGCHAVEKSRTVIIDSCGANVAKPMHVGHIRTTLIGDSLRRVYKFCGDKVISDNHLGDWGLQMGMMIEALKKVQPELTYFDKDYTGEYPSESPLNIDELTVMYPQASGICKSDEEEMTKARQATQELQTGRRGYVALWQHFVNISINEMKSDLAKLGGIEFDLWRGESFYEPVMPALVEDLQKREITIKSQGAWIIEVAKPEDENDKTPPLLLVKSDGAYLYATSDLATIKSRIEELKADKIINVVDQRQNLHFKQVFHGAEVGGIANSEKVEMVFAGFGTVNGKDGKPFKTRTGGVMKLGSLLDEALEQAQARTRQNDELSADESAEIARKVAVATIKFADLSNLRSSDYIFDIEKASQFEGKTGPYLLYSAVRIKSIMRKAIELGISEEEIQNGKILPSDISAELNLHLVMAQLPTAIQRTYDKYEPHHLCDFAYNLASQFSRFYTECPILGEDNVELRLSRLAIANLCLRQLELVLNLIGIEVPERM